MKNTKTIEELLEDWVVLWPESWENDTRGIEDWYAVVNTEGIIAYFGNEADALRFRLNEINRILNG